MQYKVPQNIDIEDKVIGPLTLKQFIYLAVGSGILFVIRYALPSAVSFLFLPIAVIIGAFFAAMAFYRPGDRPFEVYLASILSTLTKPRRRVWKKIPWSESQKSEVRSQKEENPLEKNIRSEDLERLAFIVDSGGFEEELKGKGFITAMQGTAKLAEVGGLKDTISASENPNKELNTMLSQAKKQIKKTEPSIQEMASVKPGKKYEYEKLPETASQKEFKSLFELSKKRQEERFREAKITK